jgi:hypothetical protein
MSGVVHGKTARLTIVAGDLAVGCIVVTLLPVRQPASSK